MSKKEKETHLSLRERLHVLRYFLNIAWRENKRSVCWTFISEVPAVFLPFITMIIPKLIIDELLEQRRIPWLAAWVLLMISSEILLRYLYNYANMRDDMGYEWFDYYVERRLSEKVMRMQFPLTENPQAMDQYQQAVNGFEYSGGIGMLLASLTGLISSALTMAGVVGIISSVSPLLLLMAVLVVLINLFLKSKEIKLEMHYYNLFPKIDRVFDYVFSGLSDFAYGKDIRLYHGTGMIQEMASGATDRLYAISSESANKRQGYRLLAALTDTLNNLFTYGYLGILTLLGRITIGDFTMLMNAAETLTQNCLVDLLYQLQGIGNILERMDAYRSFMEFPEEVEEGTALPTETLRVPLIEFRDVTFRYPDTEQDVLQHVNLTIQPGEHICVVGENGAGKTTFIKLLCRLYPVTSGDILLNGVSIYDYSYTEYLRLLSVVFQDFKLFSFTIRDNLLLAGDTLSDKQLQEICRLAGFGERLLELPKGLDTGLYKNFYEDGIEPSGGEAQKLAIARALCKKAPIVILDEPTAALDPLAEAEIYEHFQEMSRNKTAIFISHRLSSCQFCDRVIVFAGHGIAESGPHKELAAKPDGLYAAMFRAQAENYQ